MLKHILFLRPIEKKDLEKILANGQYGLGVEFINGKIHFGRLEIEYINDPDQFVIGLKCDPLRQIDVETFYSIVEYIGKTQISIHRLYKF
jgi:hypothetical protein